MSDPQILDKQAIGMAELHDEMEKIEERDEELSFRAGRTMEYIKAFENLSVEEYEEIKEAIEDLDVPRLKEKHIIKITDFMPDSVEELRILLDGYTLTVTDDNLEKIVDVLKEHK